MRKTSFALLLAFGAFVAAFNFRSKPTVLAALAKAARH